MLQNALRSRTFWGYVLGALTLFLHSKGIVAKDTAILLELGFGGLAFYGARNTKSKK